MLLDLPHLAFKLNVSETPFKLNYRNWPFFFSLHDPNTFADRMGHPLGPVVKSMGLSLQFFQMRGETASSSVALT